MNKLTYNKLCKVAKSDSILKDPDVTKAMEDLISYGYAEDDPQRAELMTAIDNLGIRGRLELDSANNKIVHDIASVIHPLSVYLDTQPTKDNKTVMLEVMKEIGRQNPDKRDIAKDVLKERSTKGRSKGTLGSYALAALLGGGMGGFITSSGPRRDQAAAAGIGALGGLLFNYLRRKTYYGKNISV